MNDTTTTFLTTYANEARLTMAFDIAATVLITGAPPPPLSAGVRPEFTGDHIFYTETASRYQKAWHAVRTGDRSQLMSSRVRSLVFAIAASAQYAIKAMIASRVLPNVSEASVYLITRQRQAFQLLRLPVYDLPDPPLPRDHSFIADVLTLALLLLKDESLTNDVRLNLNIVRSIADKARLNTVEAAERELWLLEVREALDLPMFMGKGLYLATR